MRKLPKRYAFVPERLVTDDLRSYGAAARDLGIESRHERWRWKNNRAENSHGYRDRRHRPPPFELLAIAIGHGTRLAHAHLVTVA